MISERRQYQKNKWNQPLPAELDSEQTLILCFFDPTLELNPCLKDLKASFPKSKIVGCSSAGEIFDTIVFDQSLSCVIVKFESTKIKVVSYEINSAEESEAVGGKIAQNLFDENLKSIFLLSDGLNVNGSELTKGIHKTLSSKTNKVSVSGGLSADGSRFGKTFILDDQGVQSKKALGVGFYGEKLMVGTGFHGGWDKFGPPRKVTKSKGNILYKIDDQPALELYKTYLGDESKNLPSSALLFPLLIQQPDKVDLVRTILAVNEGDQSMVFAGDIPEGATVQLMRANLSRLIDGASVAGNISMEGMQKNNKTAVVIAVSCVGRRLVMGQKTDEELEALKSKLPEESDLVGFYSYGELSANGVTTCELHNQTMTVTILQEAV